MKSTFSRLFVSLTVILLTAMALVSVSFQWLYSRYVTNQAIASLQNEAKVITSLCQASYKDKSISNQDFFMALSVAVSVSGADAIICDSEGNILMCAESSECSHAHMQLEPSYRDRILKTGGFTHSGVIKGLYDENRYAVTAVMKDEHTGSPRAIIVVSTPVGNTLITMHRISNNFILITACVLFLAVVIMTYLVRRQSTPLQDMARVASDFGRGNFQARVTTRGRNAREVEELAQAFNNMAASLEKVESRRQEFVANISHELRTPMTTISGYVDGILDGTIPPEKSEHYLQMVSLETKRLSRLVRSMLDISRLQEKSIPEEQKNRFDLSEMAGQVLVSFEQKITKKNIDVQVDLPEHSVFTHANPDAINQVIYNLVDNGVKFCPEGGQLGVIIRENANKVHLSVWNTGEDIPDEELPLIFDRFHKIDKSRSKNRDSWGLGLYIVKTIINSHGENISVASAGGKTEFTFTLPLVR